MRMLDTTLADRMRVALCWIGIGAGVVVLSATPARSQWPQWGGPDRSFVVNHKRLPDKWDRDWPKTVWRRELGCGYSSIIVDDGVLYTMYRRTKTDPTEYTVALDRRTGETLWEQGHPSSIPNEDEEFVGPNATPLILDGRLYTLGFHGALQCRNTEDGEVLWQHDLPAEFGGEVPRWGYACSPLACGDTVVVAAGRRENSDTGNTSLVAFDRSDGRVAWASQHFTIGHSSPILIKFRGREHIVFQTKENLIGVDPADGHLLWSFKPQGEQEGAPIATPVWNGKDTVFFSNFETGYAVKLSKRKGRIRARELWSSSKVPLGMATPVLIGDMLVGSRRGSIKAPLIGVDAKTGDRLWLKRGFPVATCIWAGEELILLDHEGHLGLATVTTERLRIRSRRKLTERWSFTPPTLVGRTLYMRDEREIMALDLGKQKKRKKRG